MPEKSNTLAPHLPALTASIETRIYMIRGHKVMLDIDLAELYRVPTKRLNEQVKRNRKRFPPDFMFRLTRAETRAVLSLRSQIATLKRGRHIKYPPYAFTEQGVAMLSTVLHSDRAISVNVTIMRAFVRLRDQVSRYSVLERKMKQMEKKYDSSFRQVFETIYKLMEPPPPADRRRQMGFVLDPKSIIKI
jgi:hypothetical protein